MMKVLKVIRAQIYQMVLDKAIFLILLLFALTDVYGAYTAVENLAGDECMCGGLLFTEWFSVNEVFPFVITGLVMTKDFFDKTAYYELMSGHTRMQVFMGRFLAALVISEAWALIEVWVFPLIFMAVKGLPWGELLSPQSALIRTGMDMLVQFRVCAEFSLFTVLFRKKGYSFLMLAPFYLLPELVSSALYYGAMGLIGLNTSAQEARFNAFFRMVDPFSNLFTSNALNNISFYEWVNLADDSGNILRTAKALPDNTGLITVSLLGVGMIALIWACTAFSRKDIE